MFHLPDLPNVGYSTRKDREASDAIMTFMRDVERDRLRLLAIVCEGPDRWRVVAQDIWRGSNIDIEAIDEIYRYFVLQACTPAMQAELLKAIDGRNRDRWRALVKAAMPWIERQYEAMKLQAKWTPFDRVWGPGYGR
jgi:hypothetical protein